MDRRKQNDESAKQVKHRIDQDVIEQRTHVAGQVGHRGTLAPGQDEHVRRQVETDDAAGALRLHQHRDVAGAAGQVERDVRGRDPRLVDQARLPAPVLPV